jgi:hypothetical protein
MTLEAQIARAVLRGKRLQHYRPRSDEGVFENNCARCGRKFPPLTVDELHAGIDPGVDNKTEVWSMLAMDYLCGNILLCTPVGETKRCP